MIFLSLILFYLSRQQMHTFVLFEQNDNSEMQQNYHHGVLKEKYCRN